MNDAQKQKLSALKTANKQYARQQQWQRNVLLQECLQRIGAYRIPDETETAQILSLIRRSTMTQISHSAAPLLEPSHPYAVVWDEAQLPIIVCSGEDVAANWADITAVAFDTCLVDLSQRHPILVRK